MFFSEYLIIYFFITKGDRERRMKQGLALLLYSQTKQQPLIYPVCISMILTIAYITQHRRWVFS